MAQSEKLRKLRKDTVINETSKCEEASMMNVVYKIKQELEAEYPSIKFEHKAQLSLTDVIKEVKKFDPNYTMTEVLETSSIRPDGGFLYAIFPTGEKYLILIGEVKNQGTNSKRLIEGLKKQAQGNAIERLGKNVECIKLAVLNQKYNPFVVFGDGCDFAEGSSIIDRVKTIAHFQPLNTINTGNNLFGDRGSFFFRDEAWSEDEYYDIMMTVAKTVLNGCLKDYNE